MTRPALLIGLSGLLDRIRERLYLDLKAEKGLPDKPLYGQPCNGCGMCCVRSQCPLSVEIFGPQPLCPALGLDGGRSSCRLITHPEDFAPPSVAPRFAEAMGTLLGAGDGCDARETDADFSVADAVAFGEGEWAVKRAAHAEAIMIEILPETEAWAVQQERFNRASHSDALREMQGG